MSVLDLSLLERMGLDVYQRHSVPVSVAPCVSSSNASILVLIAADAGEDASLVECLAQNILRAVNPSASAQFCVGAPDVLAQALSHSKNTAKTILSFGFEVSDADAKNNQIVNLQNLGLVLKQQQLKKQVFAYVSQLSI